VCFKRRLTFVDAVVRVKNRGVFQTQCTLTLYWPEKASKVFECNGKVKVFPYSLPSVGPGADPGVQAVSSQVT